MKRILAIAAAAAVMLTACKLNDDPTYYDIPEITDVSFTPALDNITESDDVLVQADITNKKGSAYVCLLYQTGSDPVSALAGEVKRTETVTISEDTESFLFSATVPRQAEGKYVVCSIYCLNSYGIEALSDKFVYTVLSADGSEKEDGIGN